MPIRPENRTVAPTGLACCLRCRDFVIWLPCTRSFRTGAFRNPSRWEREQIRKLFPGGWSGFQKGLYHGRPPCKPVVMLTERSH